MSTLPPSFPPPPSDVLTGAVEPGGRLPNSWIRAVGQAGSGASPWLQLRVPWGDACGGAEARCYGAYTGSANPPTPLWAFGEGAGYTSFAITALDVTPQLPGNQSVPLVARVTVNNTGQRAGAAVVQVGG